MLKDKKIKIKKDVPEKLSGYIKDNRISCFKCHLAAQELDVSPADIGRQLDQAGCKIIHCQLGLFGHKTENTILNKKITIPEGLKEKLMSMQTEGRLSCVQCWNIADEFKIKRLHIASMCEKMNLKIKPCQLGTF